MIIRSEDHDMRNKPKVENTLVNLLPLLICKAMFDQQRQYSESFIKKNKKAALMKTHGSTTGFKQKMNNQDKEKAI